MPGAPRFTQKPSIQQTPTGDLLMECVLECEPPPAITWQHSGTPLPPGPRVEQTLDTLGANQYKAILVIKEPNAGDGGAYRCTAKNSLGESNANINLNFAGGGEEPRAKGPTFVGKPRIIPKDGGALIVMECRVKSTSTPTARWMKDGVPLTLGGLYHAEFEDLGDNVYLCQLEIRGPSTSDAGQYRCNIKNAEGETNANLALNFEEPEEEIQEKQEKKEKKRVKSRSSSARKEGSKSPAPGEEGSRPGSPKKKRVERRSKSREGTATPKKTRSRTTTPVPMGDQLTPQDAGRSESRRSSKTEKMEVDAASSATKRKTSDAAPSPRDAEEKRLRKGSASPAPEPEPKQANGGTHISSSRTETKVESSTSDYRKESAISSTTADGRTDTSKSSYEQRTDSTSTSSVVTAATGTAEIQSIGYKETRDRYKRSPVVMEPATSMTARPGESVTMVVEWQCHTSTQITWFKDGKPVKASSYFVPTFDGKLARLTINNVDEEHAGLFKCYANSDFGDGQSSAILKVDTSQEDESFQRKHSEQREHLEELKQQEKKLLQAEKQRDEEKKETSVRKKSPSPKPKSKEPSPKPPSRRGSEKPPAEEEEPRRSSVRQPYADDEVEIQ